MIKISGNRKKRRYISDMNVLSFSFISAFSHTFIDSSRFFIARHIVNRVLSLILKKEWSDDRFEFIDRNHLCVTRLYTYVALRHVAGLPENEQALDIYFISCNTNQSCPCLFRGPYPCAILLLVTSLIETKYRHPVTDHRLSRLHHDETIYLNDFLHEILMKVFFMSYYRRKVGASTHVPASPSY